MNNESQVFLESKRKELTNLSRKKYTRLLMWISLVGKLLKSRAAKAEKEKDGEGAAKAEKERKRNRAERKRMVKEMKRKEREMKSGKEDRAEKKETKEREMNSKDDDEKDPLPNKEEGSSEKGTAEKKEELLGRTKRWRAPKREKRVFRKKEPGAERATRQKRAEAIWSGDTQAISGAFPPGPAVSTIMSLEVTELMT